MDNNIITNNQEDLNEPPKILIVDDDQGYLETIRKLLSKLGANIYEVNSGQKALSLLLRHDFMLILLDIKMPNMDGFETAQLIRQNKSSMHIPIIFMTAYDKDEFKVNEGYKLGAIDYLFKPINEDILLCKVDIFLRFFLSKKEGIRREKEKNAALKKAQLAALNIMEDANEARVAVEKSEALIKRQAKELENIAHTVMHDLHVPIDDVQKHLATLKKDSVIKKESSLEAINEIKKSISRCKNLIKKLNIESKK